MHTVLAIRVKSVVPVAALVFELALSDRLGLDVAVGEGLIGFTLATWTVAHCQLLFFQAVQIPLVAHPHLLSVVA